MSHTDPKVIVALDYSDANQAFDFASSVSPELCRVKIGKELFTRAGPDLVKQLNKQGYDVFLDLKFHDIPHTVNKAIAAACELGVWMVNVHALGGQDMMISARQAIETANVERKPLLIAVSILTSTTQQGLEQLGIQKSIQQTVYDLTTMALESGLDGMVCSAQEATNLREQFGSKPILVTPGIRPAGAAHDDQHRIMTPQKAIQSGSSYLVIGRPITQSENPVKVLEQINKQIAT